MCRPPLPSPGKRFPTISECTVRRRPRSRLGRGAASLTSAGVVPTVTADPEKTFHDRVADRGSGRREEARGASHPDVVDEGPARCGRPGLCGEPCRRRHAGPVGQPGGRRDRPTVVGLAGRHPGQATPGQPLRAWYDEHGHPVPAAAPGLTVETVLKDPDGVKQLAAYRAAFGAGEGPDVAMMYPAGFTTTLRLLAARPHEVAPDVLAQFPPTSCATAARASTAPASRRYSRRRTSAAGCWPTTRTSSTRWVSRRPSRPGMTSLAAGQKLKDAGFTPVPDGQPRRLHRRRLPLEHGDLVPTSDRPDRDPRGQLPLTDAKFVDPCGCGPTSTRAASSTRTRAPSRPSRPSRTSSPARRPRSRPTTTPTSTRPWATRSGHALAGHQRQHHRRDGGPGRPGLDDDAFSEDVPLARRSWRRSRPRTPRRGRSRWPASRRPTRQPTDSKAPDPASAEAVRLWADDFSMLSLDTVMPLETQIGLFQGDGPGPLRAEVAGRRHAGRPGGLRPGAGSSQDDPSRTALRR